MKMSEFERLAQAEQLDILYTDGAFVGKLRNAEFIRLLYQLNEFYVEVIYTRHRFQVHAIRFTDGTDILEPYLSQIKL